MIVSEMDFDAMNDCHLVCLVIVNNVVMFCQLRLAVFLTERW